MGNITYSNSILIETENQYQLLVNISNVEGKQIFTFEIAHNNRVIASYVTSGTDSKDFNELIDKTRSHFHYRIPINIDFKSSFYQQIEVSLTLRNLTNSTYEIGIKPSESPTIVVHLGEKAFDDMLLFLAQGRSL